MKYFLLPVLKFLGSLFVLIDKAIFDYSIEMNRRGGNFSTKDWFENIKQQ